MATIHFHVRHMTGFVILVFLSGLFTKFLVNIYFANHDDKQWSPLTENVLRETENGQSSRVLNFIEIRHSRHERSYFGNDDEKLNFIANMNYVKQRSRGNGFTQPRKEKTFHHKNDADSSNNQRPMKIELKPGLIVDWWFDICINRTTWSSRWHPLFPASPDKTTVTFTAGDLQYVNGRLFRRMYGYLRTRQSGIHEFQLKSRDGAEVILLDDIIHPDEIIKKLHRNVKSGNNLAYWNLTLDEMIKQDKTLGEFDLYDVGRRKIWLNKAKLYYIEILHGGNSYGQLQFHWKLPYSASFQIIGKDNLWHRPSMSAKSTSTRLPPIPEEKFKATTNELQRLSFSSLPVLQLPTSAFRNSSGTMCAPTNWYKRKVKRYIGRLYVDYTVVYPKEHFEYTGGWPLNHILMNEKEARDIGHRTFLKLNLLHDNTLELKRIVHIQHNLKGLLQRYREWWQTHYFVELDVFNAGQLYRTSVFVHDSPSHGICFMGDYTWKERAYINVLTPVRNQIKWLAYLAQQLQSIVRKTKDRNINWIVIDHNSTDGDIAALLNSYDVPHDYLFVSSNTSFNKVKSLNVGLNHVTRNDSIVFVLDLHLQIPLNLFDRVRKLSIRGKTVFCPTLLKFQCGEHEQYTDMKGSLWIDDGFGMMAMYKSDWIKVGGFNEKLFGNQWGGEDWELVDRIVTKGYFVIHNRLPRFYHIYHSNHVTWDGKHL